MGLGRGIFRIFRLVEGFLRRRVGRDWSGFGGAAEVFVQHLLTRKLFGGRGRGRRLRLRCGNGGGLRLGGGLRSRAGDRRGDGLLSTGDAEGPVIDADGAVFLLHLGFELVHLAEGFEGGLHEASEGRDLAVVDDMTCEGVADGVEVFEDGGVVFHVDEAYEGCGGPGVGVAGLEFELAEAAVVVEAEVFAAKGGASAAGAVELEVTAAGPVEVHWISPGSGLEGAAKKKTQPGRLGDFFFSI